MELPLALAYPSPDATFSHRQPLLSRYGRQLCPPGRSLDMALSHRRLQNQYLVAPPRHQPTHLNPPETAFEQQVQSDSMPSPYKAYIVGTTARVVPPYARSALHKLALVNSPIIRYNKLTSPVTRRGELCKGFINRNKEGIRSCPGVGFSYPRLPRLESIPMIPILMITLCTLSVSKDMCLKMPTIGFSVRIFRHLMHNAGKKVATPSSL